MIQVLKNVTNIHNTLHYFNKTHSLSLCVCVFSINNSHWNYKRVEVHLRCLNQNSGNITEIAKNVSISNNWNQILQIFQTFIFAQIPENERNFDESILLKYICLLSDASFHYFQKFNSTERIVFLVGIVSMKTTGLKKEWGKVVFCEFVNIQNHTAHSNYQERNFIHFAFVQFLHCFE